MQVVKLSGGSVLLLSDMIALPAPATNRAVWERTRNIMALRFVMMHRGSSIARRAGASADGKDAKCPARMPARKNAEYVMQPLSIASLN